MFVDTAKVRLKAGKGGDGAVSFRHEIYIPKGGPDGGDGGRGGSIIFRADKDTNTLIDFRFNPELTAENGKNGAGQRAAGRSGKDLIVEVPIGTVVRRVLDSAPAAANSAHASSAPLPADSISAPSDSVPASADSAFASDDSTPAPAEVPAGKTPLRLGEILADFTRDQEEAVIAHGGAGGFGNAHFKSSTRQAPLIAEVGEPGETLTVALELKTIADFGLVGLPNAGKSTFLSRVSNARPEIADYPFTTLTPQLGVATIDGQDMLLADIPGLISGAAEGKGLGHDFLRHVERTSALLHLVDVYNDDAGQAYRTIRRELQQYGQLDTRPEIVALTKCEGVDSEIIQMQQASILAENPAAEIYAISSQSGQGLDDVLRALLRAKSAHLAAAPAPQSASLPDLPVIQLTAEQLDDTWQVEKSGQKFIVRGPKIEKFALRTDLANYASVNRLRDILKKLGIRAELTNQGAQPDSVISIAGKEFTLVEE